MRLVYGGAILVIGGAIMVLLSHYGATSPVAGTAGTLLALFGFVLYVRARVRHRNTKEYVDPEKARQENKSG